MEREHPVRVREKISEDSESNSDIKKKQELKGQMGREVG